MPDASLPLTRPRGVLVAAVVVALEGLALIGLAVVGLADLVTSRLEVGLSVAVFFAAYGALLLGCAWGLARLDGWTRGPVLITQLIVLGLAWNARANVPLALGFAVVGVVAIVAMLRPSTIQALLDRPA